MDYVSRSVCVRKISEEIKNLRNGLQQEVWNVPFSLGHNTPIDLLIVPDLNIYKHRSERLVLSSGSNLESKLRDPFCNQNITNVLKINNRLASKDYHQIIKEHWNRLVGSGEEVCILYRVREPLYE